MFIFILDGPPFSKVENHWSSLPDQMIGTKSEIRRIEVEFLVSN